MTRRPKKVAGVSLRCVGMTPTHHGHPLEGASLRCGDPSDQTCFRRCRSSTWTRCCWGQLAQWLVVGVSREAASCQGALGASACMQCTCPCCNIGATPRHLFGVLGPCACSFVRYISPSSLIFVCFAACHVCLVCLAVFLSRALLSRVISLACGCWPSPAPLTARCLISWTIWTNLTRRLRPGHPRHVVIRTQQQTSTQASHPGAGPDTATATAKAPLPL